MGNYKISARCRKLHKYRQSLTALAVLLVFAPLAQPALSAQSRSTRPGRQGRSAKNNLFYWHINAQYVNDFQNGNLAISMDDRYTYGLNTLFSLNNWDLFLQYRVLTDRYVSRTRIDELETGLRYTFGNLLSPRLWRGPPGHYNRRSGAGYRAGEAFYLGLVFSAAYFQAGNIQGHSFQNVLHWLSNIPQVNARYLESVYTVSLGTELYFSYTIDMGKLLPDWEKSLLELGISARGQTAIGYRESLQLGLRSKLYSGNQYLQWDFYLQQLGYYNGFGKANNIESVWSDTSTAFWLAFSSRSGLYQRRVDLSLGSLTRAQGLQNQKEQLAYPFGFGSLELSWASLDKPRRFVRPDYSQSLLLGINNGLILDRFSFFFQLADRIPGDFSIVVTRDLYGDPQLFEGNPLARKAEAFWLTMLGLRPTLDLKKWGFLEFYAGVGAGVLTMQLLNSISELSTRSNFQFFTLGGQAGLRWYGLSLRKDGAVYGLEVALLGLLPFAQDQSVISYMPTGILLDNLKPGLNFMVGFCILADW